MASIDVRQGTVQDIPFLYRMICLLAEYEKAPNEVAMTPKRLEEDFDRGLYRFLIAETEGVQAGMALYYFRYSTWKGICLYLEDLVVEEAYRRHGVGEALWSTLLRIAKQEKCSKMNWQVLDWNEPALAFYRKHGATLDATWINGALDVCESGDEIIKP